MVKISQHYADSVSSGAVTDADQALALLTEKLTRGDPVVIDILVRLDRPESGAHFVVVTGLDLTKPSQPKIYFNDPLTGSNRWSYWLGGEGVWNGWQSSWMRRKGMIGDRLPGLASEAGPLVTAYPCDTSANSAACPWPTSTTDWRLRTARIRLH